MRTCLSEVIQVPDLGAVAAGTDSPRVSVEFFRRAWVVGVQCISLDNDTPTSRGSLALAMDDAGQRAIHALIQCLQGKTVRIAIDNQSRQKVGLAMHQPVCCRVVTVCSRRRCAAAMRERMSKGSSVRVSIRNAICEEVL